MAPPPDENVVLVDEVVVEFQRALREHDRPNASKLVALLLELHDTNLSQWSFEDRVRSAGVDIATIAQAKEAIDRLNVKRHQLVEEIDVAIGSTMPQVPSATPATESPAMVLDRLSVLVIRIHHTELAVGADGSGAQRYAARLPVLYRQLAVLQEALDALLADVREGRRRFVPYQSLKLYTQ
jgi:hypothetical protein